MAASIGIILILGLLVNALFKRLNIPGLLGLLLVGIIIGPYGLNWLTPDIMTVSGDFRKIALIILAIAVLSILTTALLDTIAIRESANKIIITTL